VGVPSELSLWDDHPIAQAIQVKEFAAFILEGSSMVVLPFTKNYSPVGGVVLNVNGVIDEDIATEPTTTILSQLGAYYLDMNGLQVKQAITRGGEPSGELTERQLKVLSMMSLGQTNAEIARALLLSESTIRQETVRIYRSLDVNSRNEASKKGKALGLISRSGGGGGINPPV
jgi:DNA-binding CsgD family transcriptional regulator